MQFLSLVLLDFAFFVSDFVAGKMQLLLLPLFCLTVAAGAGFAPAHVKVEYKNALNYQEVQGLSTAKPRFFWQMAATASSSSSSSSPQRDLTQSAYQIKVFQTFISPGLTHYKREDRVLAANLVWDSDYVKSSQTSHVAYEGSALSSFSVFR
jgi:hypothetical protein